MDTRLPDDAREARMLADSVLADFDGETTSAMLDASRNERSTIALGSGWLVSVKATPASPAIAPPNAHENEDTERTGTPTRSARDAESAMERIRRPSFDRSMTR